MVMTKDHMAEGCYPQAVFNLTSDFYPRRVLLYNSHDLPNLHAPHEYLHIKVETNGL